ncbi:hypothetical protein [Streptomyces sp. NPDC056549]|uniref:hypothetical protein n=1 Tax=Streptomyces sp. NPDC056549 TaxID=3345864 RepID=UPI0036B68DCC
MLLTPARAAHRTRRGTRTVRETPLLRGALVGGAVYAAGRSSARAVRHEEDQEQAIAELQGRQQPPAPPPPAPRGPPVPVAPPAAAAAPSITDQPARLGEMAQQGLLTPGEFAAAKARLLGV